MAFDGEAFVTEICARSCRLRAARSTRPMWVERVVQGEATPQDLVGWARQHYWGVTYHTRRFLSAWVTRMPVRDDRRGHREHRRGGARHDVEVGARATCTGCSSSPAALGAPDEVITEATPNVDAVASESFLYRPRLCSGRGTR